MQRIIVLQILFLTMLNLTMACWGMAYTPMINFLNDLVLIVNENLLLLSSYFVLLFTNYVPTIENQHRFGNV